MARCTSAAATAESTPPESPQMACRSPIWSRIRSICSSTMLTIVQVGRQPAMSWRKWVRTAWPCSVCMTSGCHCTPAKPRSTCSKAATGEWLGRREHREAGGRGDDRVAVAHPHPVLRGDVGQQRPRLGDLDGGAAVLRPARAAYLSPEALRHRLEAVAHAEHRHPGVEERVVDPRRARLVDRRRTAGEDDRLRALREHLRDRHRGRHDLGVDPGLADPAGDELGVLRPEVDDEDQVVICGHGRPFPGGSRTRTASSHGWIGDPWHGRASGTPVLGPRGPDRGDLDRERGCVSGLVGALTCGDTRVRKSF